MKARASLEVIPIIKDFIYGNKIKCIVKKEYGRFETHYYDIGDNNILQIYSKDPNEEKHVDNPELVGSPTYDDDKRMICQWTWGEPLAYFLDYRIESNSMLKQLYAMVDSKTNLVMTAGILIGMNKIKGSKKGLFEDPMLLALGLVFIMAAASLLITYFGFQKHGVDLLGR